MTFDPFHDDPPDDVLPERLRADLARLDPTPTVPASIDAAVRAAGRAYLGRQRRVRLWTRSAAAVAAVLAVGIGARLALPPAGGTAGLAERAVRPASTAAAVPVGPADVNGDGVVDVLDALAVARGVKAGRTDPAWDVTGDGVVDQRDVDAIAASAVRVGRRVQ